MLLDIINYWETRDNFKNTTDIPEIPIVNKEIYDSIIIPNIIRCGGIPKKDLIVGREYSGSCRNSEKAKWNGKCFEYLRTKFGSTYIDTINHFEDDDGYDLFIPIELC